MTRKRIIYLTIIPITIAMGLLVRFKKAWLPNAVNLYLGDALYAFMMYYIVSFLFPNSKSSHRAGAALIVCYCIEVFQLYNALWINAVRATLAGRLVLGSGFLYSDLVAYFAGVLAAFAIDGLWLSKRKLAA
jgi:hypothetical protein